MVLWEIYDVVYPESDTDQRIWTSRVAQILVFCEEFCR